MTKATEPAYEAEAITPSDTAVLANDSRGVYVGGAGNIKVTTVGGSTVTFSGVAAGSLLPIRVNRVYSTGTTATLILTIY